MIIIISPAKTLKFNQYSSNLNIVNLSLHIRLWSLQAPKIIHFKRFDEADENCEKLGDLNAQRYSQFSKNPDEKMPSQQF